MAQNLMSTIREKLQSPTAGAGAGQQIGGVTDQTERAQGLLRAKMGKAGQTGTAPRRSNIQEQQQAAQTRLGAQQLQQQGEIQSQQLQQQEEQQQVQEEETLANMLDQREDVRQRFEIQSQNIVSDLERNMQQMDSRERVAKMEQAGFALRLQNKDYLSKLNREAQRAGLESELDFKEQMARTQFADMEDLFRDKLAFQRIADMSQREFQEEMSQIDINTALQVAQTQAKAASQQQLFQGIGQVIGAGASMAANNPEWFGDE